MIGLFDSGVGGLSVAREIMRRLPTCPLVYLADQDHAPYGPRPLAEIRTFSGEIARFLLAHGAQVVVVACNTASAAALHWLRREFPDVPFVGMEPALKPATERTRTRHVGVIATAATFQGELFASLIDRYAADVVVHTQVCAQLVPLVEAGELDTPAARAAVEGYLAPLVAAGIDELVLGCTHYPFLRPLIEEAVGPHVEVIDPAGAVARQTERVLAQAGWLTGNAGDRIARSALSGGSRRLADEVEGCAEAIPADEGDCSPAPDRFFTTGDPVRFQAALQNLLGVRSVVQPAMWNAEGQLHLPR
jgi:glutamate racemase